MRSRPDRVQRVHPSHRLHGHVQFVGRTAELEALATELRHARAGELRVVLVTGDAGIGKTRLAAEAASRAGDEIITLTARGHAIGAATPFGLWIEALERHLRTLTAEQVRALAGPAAVGMALLLPTVEASRPGQAPREVSSYRLLMGFVALLASIAAGAPIVLVLDDVHLADTASWETLHFLALDRPDLPLLVIATARAAELAEHPVGPDIVFALEQEGKLRLLRLEPMRRDELVELARLETDVDLVPESLVGWLEDRSRGNPLFALGLLAALLDEGGNLARPSLTAVPEDLRERVLARLRGLEDPERSTLELLALLGSAVELPDLGRMAGRPIDTVAVSLAELMRRRLVREDERGGGPAYEVAHPLVQETIYQSTMAERRRGLHRTIGRTLLASGQLASGAAHLARSAEPGDPEAVGALIAALREAEERSLYRAAAAVMAELVGLLPEGDERWLRVLDVMEPRAEWVLAHLAEDHAGEAHEGMRRIEQLVEAEGDDRRRGTVQLRMACFGGVPMGRLAEALERCGRAADLFMAAGEPGLALAARVESAYVLAMQGENAAAIESTREVLRRADAIGDALAQLHALVFLGWALPYVGALEEAADFQGRGARLAQKAGSHYRWSLLRHGNALSLAYMGRLGEANALYAQSARDSPAAIDALRYEQGAVLAWLAGDLEAALVAASKATARNRTTTSVRQAPYLALGARAAIDADRLDGVEDIIRLARQASAGFGSVWAVYPEWAWGVLAWRHRRSDAVDQLVAAARRARDLEAPVETMWFLVDVSEAASELGAPDAARWAATEASAAVGPVASFPLYAALRDLIVAIAHPDASRARSATCVFAELGYRLWLGRGQLALGRTLARENTSAAVAAVEEAAETFQACGAAWHRERALLALRSLGSRGRRAAAAAAGPPGLTAREVEVARLAAAGHTAREIGERLYIGERTVETHLANVYAKLRVQTKRELVQRAAELGLRT